MSKGWRTSRLGEIAEIVGGGTPSSKVPEYWNGDVPWISPSDLSGYKYRYISHGAKSLTTLGLKKSSARLHPPGTLLFTSRAPIGYVAIAANSIATNQGFQSLRVDRTKLNIHFAYYLLIVYTPVIQAFGTGATFPEVSARKVGQVKVRIPNLNEQEKIARVLSAYDELIENNLKRIKLLEQSISLQFGQFQIELKNGDCNKCTVGEVLDFHIGGGWGEEEADEKHTEQAYVIRGTDIDDIGIGSHKAVPNRYHTASNLSSRLLCFGDIIFEVSGGSKTQGVGKSLLISNGVLRAFTSKVICASFCKLVRPLDTSYSVYLWAYFKMLRDKDALSVFEKRSASSIVNFNWKAFLKQQKLQWPDEIEIQRWNTTAGPLIEVMDALMIQVVQLQEARDILLPRLMTGMIDVEELDVEVPIKA